MFTITDKHNVAWMSQLRYVTLTFMSMFCTVPHGSIQDFLTMRMV